MYFLLVTLLLLSRVLTKAKKFSVWFSFQKLKNRQHYPVPFKISLVTMRKSTWLESDSLYTHHIILESTVISYICKRQFHITEQKESSIALSVCCYIIHCYTVVRLSLLLVTFSAADNSSFRHFFYRYVIIFCHPSISVQQILHK